MTKPDRGPLHARRKRLHERVERAAAQGPTLARHFAPELRQKLIFAFHDSASERNRESVAGLVVHLMLRDEGWASLPGVPTEALGWALAHRSGTALDQCEVFLQVCPDDYVPTVVEAMYQALGLTFHLENIQSFIPSVNQALAEDDLAFEFVNGQMVEIESRELHTAVVAPTLSLLGVDRRFNKAEHAYRQALSELASGEPGDAITDAGTALQEALDALGCVGDTLGAKFAAAKKLGLLGGHDAKLAKAFELSLDWASANRSVRGESHHVTDADRNDGWLMVHIVGSLILRLSRGRGD